MEVILDNVFFCYVDDFVKINKFIVDIWGFVYDYFSIMYYSERIFINNGFKIIKVWYLYFFLYKCFWVFFKVGF